jgi:hypothetical protein
MLYADSIKKIEFINVPPCGAGANSRGDIAGQIYNLEDSDKYKVVLYAHTDRWYVQPLISHPFTNIDNSGKWSNWTHLGNRYAALVVKLAFKPPSKSLSLPVGDDVILTAETPSSTECHR